MVKSVKDYRVREKKIINDLPGFKSCPLSGAGVDYKEDGVSSQFLLQLKSTENDSMPVTTHVLAELQRHALMAHKKPVLMLDFVNGGTYFCIRKEDFLLYHIWLEEREGMMPEQEKVHEPILKENMSFFDLIE